MKPQLRSRVTRWAVTVVVAALVAAVLWAGWLGWDNTYYRLPPQFPGDEGLHGPWATAQVIGYAVMVMVVAVLAAARWNPLLVGVGMFAGTWVPFTLWALANDDGGLAIIGIMLAAAGMGLGAILCSAVGFIIGGTRRARHQRAAT